MAPKKSSATSRSQAGKPEEAGELVPVDTEKVDAAVRYINERTIQSGLDLAREVGDYVLETFFDGDFASFTNPSRSKSTSFRALLAREDLLLGHATIYGFVRVSHQLKTLPAEVVSRLTLTQHRALLPLPDPERKEAMARQALDEGWSAEELEAEVRKLLPRSRRGRKPLPPFVKGIRNVVKALDLAFENQVTPEAVTTLGPKETSALSAQVEESLARLEALKQSLEEAQKEPGSAA